MKNEIIKIIIETSKKATVSTNPEDVVKFTQAILNATSALSLLTTMEGFSDIKVE